MGTVNLKEAFDRATQLRDNGKIAEAILIYQDVATLAQEQNQTELAAEALHMAGNAVKMTIGRGEESKFRSASEFFSRAYALYGSSKDFAKQGTVLRDIAIAAGKVGHQTIALESFQRSIEFLSRAEEPAELGMTYDKLGLHFTNFGQPEKALPYLDKAVDLLRQEPTYGFYRATTSLDRAATNLALKNYDQAISDAEEALGWYEADHGGPTYNVRRAQCSALLGLLYEKIGNNKEARAHLAQSARLLKMLDQDVAARVQADIEQWATRL